MMLYEVKVRKPNGEIKKVISPKQLSQIYWAKVEQANSEIHIPNNWKASVPQWVRERLDVEFF